MPVSVVGRLSLFAGILAITSVFLSGQGSMPPSGSKVPKYGYTVVKSYPHDPKAYTQGLEYNGGVLFEATGLKGQSGVRKVELETGESVAAAPDGDALKVRTTAAPCRHVVRRG